jgi:hypothetical protein
MVGNRHDQVRANRSNRQRFADDDLHNGQQFNYYDKLSKKEVMSESDENSADVQVKATNQTLVKKDISPVEPAISLNRMMN